MISLALLGTLLGLALIDSINPSALLIAGLILAKATSEQKTQAIGWYVAGVFVTNFLLGMALVFGLDALVSGLGNALESRTSYIIQAVLGANMLVWGIVSKPKAREVSRFMPKLFTFKPLFLLGVGVTAIELITAFPYFGAIGLMERADVALPAVVAIIFAYNIIFILPPLLLVVIYHFNKVHFDAWLQKRQAKSKPNDTLQWIIALLGLLILQDALQVLLATN